MKNDLRITFPSSNFLKLDKEIKSYIDKSIEEFMNDIQGNEQNFPYSLYIYYDEYRTKEYRSYVFYKSLFTGGAHPRNTIFTINYNTKTNTIVDINNLINDYPNLLNTFSYQSRMQLKNTKQFHDPRISKMLIEGTKPSKENFKNFIFSENGIILFFQQYQIAPYYMGQFKTIIQ